MGQNREMYGICHEYVPEHVDTVRNSLYTMDAKQCAIILYRLYDAIGDVKSMNAIKALSEFMYHYPTNVYGGYWHKITTPHQMWLDGAFMGGPPFVKYEKHFGAPVLRERAIKQIFLMEEHMKDAVTGLYYHGWDPTQKQTGQTRKPDVLHRSGEGPAAGIRLPSLIFWKKSQRIIRQWRG